MGQEENHLVWCSRKCKIKSLHCIACNVPFVITELAKPGYGGHCGCPSNPILNVPNLLNTKQNMRKRSLSPKQTLTRPLLSAIRSLRNTTGSVLQRMNTFLLFRVVDLPSKKSSTKRTA